VNKLLAGVVLDDDPKPVRAAACALVDTHRLDLTLTEGKYHQVKRMLAAVGNRVEGLHRSQIGSMPLPADLAPGQWRWLGADDLKLLDPGARLISLWQHHPGVAFLTPSVFLCRCYALHRRCRDSRRYTC